jgi:hypothetical protein
MAWAVVAGDVALALAASFSGISKRRSLPTKGAVGPDSDIEASQDGPILYAIKPLVSVMGH